MREALCNAKTSHLFSTRNIGIFKIIFRKFNETLTNDFISFEQLGPGLLNRGLLIKERVSSTVGKKLLTEDSYPLRILRPDTTTSTLKKKYFQLWIF